MANADVTTDAVAELDSDDVVTVATLSEEIGEVIDDHPELDNEHVVGDASDCRESNGHLHFDLIAGETSIHCVVFGFRRQQLNAKPDEEMHVAVRGDLSYYQPQGSCSILVDDVVNMGESKYSQIYAENKQMLC